jgi:hypothetical protein
MRYAQGPVLATLPEAIAWAQSRWGNQRTVPVRLHEAHTTEGELGAPRFSHAFAAALDGSANATTSVEQSTPCAHPGRGIGQLCPMCVIHDSEGKPLVETNVYVRRVHRFSFPMTRALDRLANALRPARDRMPHPYRTVMALAGHGWDPHAAVRSLDLGWDAGEAHLLRSLRQLHRWYEEAPVTTSYIDKSEAQRNAEEWAIAG